MWLASDGNYREYRWFITWTQVKRVVDFTLPEIIRSVNGQEKTKLGDALIATQDCCIGIEMCEELFVPQSAHIGMSLDGAEIIVNGSGSHHELRKLDRRISLVKEATMKVRKRKEDFSSILTTRGFTLC
ncbi:Glutamine-dependent NAD(+) synthetase [Zancudomyces culisetae]|uniref:NAD(+) synthase [glutamine-hydrolyzing] n=1 Tax=Zancudomyces culisetae TaxID=1213189 RepID=A0A1R1PYF9_ZANCU|nr:Glutamine-dependent NAD(+) synthetase [Zancudomyces culisetae]|eukprot:OMH85984.1 Glutamine-dependent NAD(+) synthetase [Zancudomyces culisetae]